MNPTGDRQAVEPVDRRLAEYHETLLAGGSRRKEHADPAFDGARQCLNLFERVRRQAPLPDPGWLFAEDDPQTTPPAADDHPLESETGAHNAPPHQIGRFRIIRRIGEGGFGIVFEAFDPQLNRPVALKVPRPEALISEQWRRRFLREAEAAALLNHPHLVPVYEAGNAGSLCYIVQPLFGGVSLDRWLEAHPGPVAPAAAARLIRTLAEAVQHAHSRGVLHRDIKPSNVLLGTGSTPGAEGEVEPPGRATRAAPAGTDTVRWQDHHTLDDAGLANDAASAAPDGGAAPSFTADDLANVARLTDFGLARVVDDASDQTRTGTVLGTPAYMAPEQADGRPRDVGTASDVYSLGAVLYELLAGRPPFAEATLLGTLRAVRECDPRPLRHQHPQIPADLDAICAKCLEKDPQRRYATASDLARDLGRFLDGESISARRATRRQRLVRWCRRNPVPAALTAIVILLTVILAGASTAAALLLAEAREDTLDSLEQAIAARDRATKNEDLALRAVYEARLAQSRARRHSGQLGQRVEGLRALAEAAKHVGRLGLGVDERRLLRSEAIACMSLLDLVPDRKWPRMPPRDRRVATDPDVTRYAHAEEGWRAIVVRRMDDNQLVARLIIAGGPRRVLSLCFSPDGQYLAAWCRPGESFAVQVWALPPLETAADRTEPVELQPVAQLPAMTGTQSRPMDFSADGTLAVALPGGDIGLLSVPGFEQRLRLQGRSPVQAMRFDPASRLLAVARSGAVDLFDAASGTQLRSLPCESFVFQLDFKPDGSLLAAGCDDGQVRLWHVDDGRYRGSLVGHAAQVTDVGFHPDGRIIATSSYDQTCRLWDVARLAQVLHADTDFTGFSRDGRWLGAGESRLRVELPQQSQVLDVPQVAGSATSIVRQLSVEPTGRLLAVSNSQQLVIIDLFTGDVVAQLRTEGYTQFDATGEWLVAALDRGLYRFRVHREETEQVIEFRIGAGQRLAASRAGHTAEGRGGEVIAVLDPRIVLHDATSRTTRTLQPGHNKARWLSLSPDARLLATGAWHGHDVHVWDARSGELQTTLPAGNARVQFDSTGERLAIDEGSHFAVLSVSDWNPVYPRTAKSFASVPGPIAFSADGRLLALLDSPRHVRLLDAASYAELASFKLTSERFIDSLVFDPQGTRLIAGTTHPGTLHVWDLRSLRENLRTMDLDWAAAPPPPAAQPQPVRLRHALYTLTPAAAEHYQALLKQVEQYAAEIEQRPDHDEGYWRRARSLVALGRFEQALNDATRATELAPSSNHGWFWRARALQMLSRSADAIASFEKSLEIYPRDAWCCLHLASLYTEGPPEVRNPERGLALAEQALELARARKSSSMAGAVPVFLNFVAAAHSRNGNPQQALDALDEAVQLSDAPPAATMLLRRALCYHELGDPERARQCYEDALDDPRHEMHEAPFNLDTLRQEAATLLDTER